MADALRTFRSLFDRTVSLIGEGQLDQLLDAHEP